MKKKENVESHRFIGVSLAGGKTDKSCVSVLEYYPKANRIFLSRVFEKIKSDEEISADLKIHEIIQQFSANLEYVAFDVPWVLPSCLTCKAMCPGYEKCNFDHVQWMWKNERERNKKKKPKKLFTPYTQRCIEMHLAATFEEPLPLPHMMGANSAPLLARAAFIARRLKVPLIEVHPKLSIWRIGRSFNIMKSHLRSTRHSVGGMDARRNIIQELNQRNVAFLYEADQKLMVENNHAFESFICALTAFLKYKDQTEERPPGFPKYETWIEYPNVRLKWT